MDIEPQNVLVTCLNGHLSYIWGMVFDGGKGGELGEGSGPGG